MFFRRELVTTPTFTHPFFHSPFFYFLFMKNLQRIALVAFAVLSAGVANAQNTCTNCTPPNSPKPDGITDPGCLGCTPTKNIIDENRVRSAATSQTSFVLQNGHNQFACVDQAGPGRNQADLFQDAKDDKSDGVNNAYQIQSNTVAGSVMNKAWADQLGDNSLVVQKQSGSGNQARSHQGDWDFNIAYQEQDGDLNKAYVNQDGGHSSFSVQTQLAGGGVGKGVNYSAVTQTGGGDWSVTRQEGANNAVTVYQH